MERVPDYVGDPGEAYGLAQRINAYWRALGYRGVKARALNLGSSEFPIWSVRSNMTNGFPPKEREA